jgi:hypothetical protein
MDTSPADALAMRSRIEVYWNSIDTAPVGEALQVCVTDGSEDYLLPYACKLTPDGWVNAATGSPLRVRPTYWKPYVETLPGRNGWKRKKTAVHPSGGDRMTIGSSVTRASKAQKHSVAAWPRLKHHE